MTYTIIKVRLIPNREQAYNFAKNYSEEYYKANGKGISTSEIAKTFRSSYSNIPWIKETKPKAIVLEDLQIRNLLKIADYLGQYKTPHGTS